MSAGGTEDDARGGYAFLALEEHPYGREMLRQLLEAGLAPALVVEECSELAGVEREKFLVRMSGFDLAPTFEELLADHPGALRVRVPNHNDEACVAALAQARPELLVLGGTRILKPPVFEVARAGALNSHPGLLPEVRGSASVAWAIERDLPIGCTCHFIDAAIDQGPIVSRREIPVQRSDTYEKLCWKTAVLSGTLMAEAVARWREGTLTSRPQEGEGETHRNMPDEGVARVKAKLAAGAYQHFVD
jgi:methionyl-tRNA formyltransferase